MTFAIALLVSAAATQPPRAVALVDELKRLPAARPWPGFDPRAVPLAVYDGRTTWLFGHPHPPEGFAAEAEWPGALSRPGRDPTLSANNWAELDGVRTATLFLEGAPERPLRDLAGLAVHEAFHVFQSRRHPDWGGNEGELFTYPVDDEAALALRRLESGALRRALSARDAGGATAWARAALALRRERFARLPEGAAAYERGTELKEGLAQYVEDRATGAAPLRRLPAEEFPAEAVRERAYASGQALGLLLDRFAPGWAERLDGGDTRPLDTLLEEALAPRKETAAAMPAGERAKAAERASADVLALRERRRERRRAFEGRPGLVVEVVAAGGEPLWPQGFDPLNVLALGGTEVLHSRFLKLGNAAGTVEVLGREALTIGVGPHPLFAGVRRLLVTGLPSEPQLQEGDGRCVVRAEGLHAELTGARVERAGGRLVLHLRAGPSAGTEPERTPPHR